MTASLPYQMRLGFLLRALFHLILISQIEYVWHWRRRQSGLNAFYLLTRYLGFADATIKLIGEWRNATN